MPVRKRAVKPTGSTKIERRKGLFGTASETVKTAIGETGKTAEAVMKSVRYGASNVELSMKESIVTAIEDLEITKVTSIQRMVDAGIDKDYATQQIANQL